jgi:hypothetical protein
MKLLSRKSETQLLLSEEDKRRENEIAQELEKKNFAKATQLASDYIKICKSPIAEANFNHIAANILIKQYGAKLPLPEYNQARKHMNRSLEIFQVMEKNETIELLIATTYAQIASLAQIIGKPEDGFKECQEALKIHQKYGRTELTKQVQKTMYFLRLAKLMDEIQDKIRFFHENNPTKDKLEGDPDLQALVEELEKLKKEAAGL